MTLVSGPTFSKANILSAVETLAWSSLPILADQVVQHLFFKNIPPRIDRTIAGLFTCAIVICYLPYGAPARVGAPFLFIAYRAALSFWNRKPKPKSTPKPPASAPSSQTPPTAKKPAATAASNKATKAPPKTGEGQPPPISVSGPDSKSEKEKAAPPALANSAKSPAAAKEEPAPPLPSITSSSPSTADPIPVQAPSSEKKSSAVDPEKKKEASAEFQKKMHRIQEQARVFMAQAERLDLEVRKNLTSISVKVKITYLLQKETESEPQEKVIPKAPEVIEAKFYINSHILFKFPKEMVPTLQKDMGKQYSITENTSFCWVFLSREKTESSRFPFVYFPIETLRFIAGKKKTMVLKIETEKQVFEIEFLRAGSKDIGKCLEKLDKCKRQETIQPDAYLGSQSNLSGKDMDGFTIQVQAALTMSKCYLTPFEKK